MEESDLPILHSSQYVSPTTVSALLKKATAKILIVGCRLSAGEIMEELFKVGHHLHLSHRSKMKYWPSPVEEALLSPFIMSWERIALKIRAPKPGNLKPRLRRGFQKSLLDDGLVVKHSDIESFKGSEVSFQDGSKAQFDLVIFATGYRPALAHFWPLLNGEKPKVSKLESKNHKNLFFLGYENSRNFRSQFLRGIRADSKFLGELLAERRPPTLESLEKAQTQLLPDSTKTQESSSPLLS